MFRAIYEVFGLNPFFSANMAQFLAGMEDLCGEKYNGGVSLYWFYGMVMVGSTVIVYFMKYWVPLFDRPKYCGRGWCWLFAGVAFLFNFLFVGIDLWKLLSEAVLKFECDEEFIHVISNISEIGTVAIVNAFISFLLFVLLSQPPYLRRWCSKNCFEQKLF
jgi:hypothetical protein